MSSNLKLEVVEPIKKNIYKDIIFDETTNTFKETESYIDEKGNVKIKKGTKRVKFPIDKNSYLYILVNETTDCNMENIKKSLISPPEKPWNEDMIYAQFKHFMSSKLKLKLKNIQDFRSYIKEGIDAQSGKINWKIFNDKWYDLNYDSNRNMISADRVWLFLLSGGDINILGDKQKTELGNSDILVESVKGYYINKPIVKDIFIQYKLKNRSNINGK